MRLKILNRLLGTKPAPLNPARILADITALDLTRWNICSHSNRDMRCVLSLETASVFPLWARLKAVNTPTSSGYSRCEQ